MICQTCNVCSFVKNNPRQAFFLVNYFIFFRKKKKTITTSFGYCTVSLLTSVLVIGCDFMLEQQTPSYEHTSRTSQITSLFSHIFAFDII